MPYIAGSLWNLPAKSETSWGGAKAPGLDDGTTRAATAPAFRLLLLLLLGLFVALLLALMLKTKTTTEKACFTRSLRRDCQWQHQIQCEFLKSDELVLANSALSLSISRSRSPFLSACRTSLHFAVCLLFCRQPCPPQPNPSIIPKLFEWKTLEHMENVNEIYFLNLFGKYVERICCHTQVSKHTNKYIR